MSEGSSSYVPHFPPSSSRPAPSGYVVNGGDTEPPSPSSYQPHVNSLRPQTPTSTTSGFSQVISEHFLKQFSGQYSQHWVLQPPSVRGVEVAKASAAAKAGSGYSDQVVAKPSEQKQTRYTLALATTWLLYPESQTLALAAALALATSTPLTEGGFKTQC